MEKCTKWEYAVRNKKGKFISGCNENCYYLEYRGLKYKPVHKILEEINEILDMEKAKIKYNMPGNKERIVIEHVNNLYIIKLEIIDEKRFTKPKFVTDIKTRTNKCDNKIKVIIECTKILEERLEYI